jgi:alpha-tubulin suppressor-like RCC1 family protein
MFRTSLLSLSFVLAVFLVASPAEAQQVATPTVSLPGGTYGLERTIIVNCSTPGATIHYTTAATSAELLIPTESDPIIASGASMLIDRSLAVGFTAFKAGLTPSEFAGFEYRITGKVAAGGNHTVALRSNGEVWAWGSNINGELGDGTSGTTPRTTPTRVRINSTTFLDNMLAVAAGTSHTLALKSDGTVLAWGLNSSGQLGDGTTVQKLYPVAVKLANGTPLSGIVEIACGATHSLALKNDGTVWAWGANASGQIGDGTTTSPRSFATQVKVSTSSFLTNVVSIAGGAAHSAAAKSDNSVWCWGLNSSGQLGNNSTKSSSFPVRVSKSSGFLSAAKVYCGANHTMAGDYAWGLNTNGQLADGTTTTRKVAVPMMWPASFFFPAAPVTGILVARGGTGHTIFAYGGAATAGLNTSGQLGIGSTTQQVYAQGPVFGDGDVAAGANHSLSSSTDGTVWVAGTNNAGQLAQTSTTTLFKSPVAVAGFVIVYGLADSDGDGLLNWRERQLGTNLSLADSDGDGMPDAWEVAQGLNPLSNDAAADADGDGLSNLQEYQANSDPHDYFNGSSFNFDVSSGDGQVGPASGWLSQPFVVRVTNSSGAPLVNAPVTFSLGQAEGALSLTSGGTTFSSLSIRTNASGLAAVYYQQPPAADAPSSVNADTGTSTTKRLTLHASTADIPTTGLKLWLNAQAGATVATNGLVSVWADQSAARNTAGEQSGYLLPTYVGNAIAAKPAIKFPSATARLGGGILVPGAECSIFVVASPTGTGDGPIISRQSSYSLGTGTGGNFATLYGNGTAWNDPQPHAAQLPAGQFNILESVNNGTDSAYLNGLLVESRVSPMGAATAGYILGGNWIGDVAEIVVYDRALSNAERVTVESYLNRRYGCIGPAPTAAPANVRASSGLPTVATIQWDQQNLVSYTIERKAAINGTFQVIATGQFSSSFEDSDLVPGTEYIYRIRGTHFSGQSPYSIEVHVTTPLPVVPSTLRDPIAAGAFSACVVLQASGGVQTWGWLPGDGTSSGWRHNALPLAGVPGMVSASAANNQIVLLKSDGTVWTWGSAGTLGDGTYNSRYVPGIVPNLTGIISAKAGIGHTLALRSDGTVVAWGDNYNGALGNGLMGDAYDSPVPVAVSNLTNVKQIAAGTVSSLALKADGTVWRWGYDPHGNHPLPVKVEGLSNIIAIAAGESHAMALRMDGTIWAWGSNYYGQLGNRNYAYSWDTPVKVANISSAVAIASFHDHNLAILGDGTLWTWGRNTNGELGLGTSPAEIECTTPGNCGVRSPVRIPGLSNVTAAVAAQGGSMAMLADGSVFIWGNFLTNSALYIPEQVTLGFVDSNGNGMDDSWEWNYFGNLSQNPGADFDGDGLSNLQEYQNHTNPTDYYNATTPVIVKISGDQQTAEPNDYLDAPLVIQVNGANGQPLSNAPVTFASTEGQFALTDDGTSTFQNPLSVRTGADGRAAIYYITPPLGSHTSSMTATSTSTGPNASVQFASTTNLVLPPDAPTDVHVEAMSNGENQITWVSNSTNEHGFLIEYETLAGAWVTIAYAPPGSASAPLPPPPALTLPNYRVSAYRFDATAPSPETNPATVRYAVIDLQKDLTLTYKLEPLYLTNSGYLLLWDAEYSYLWHGGQLTNNGGFRDDMDVLEDGTVVPMPTHDNQDHPIQIWKTRNGVSIGGGFYAMWMQNMHLVNGVDVPFNALDVNSQGLVMGINSSGACFYSVNAPGQYDYFVTPNTGWTPYTLNHRLITVTDEAGNQTQKSSPHVVGENSAGAVLATENPGTGQYQIESLNRMISPGSGWNLKSAWSINDHDMITATGTYQPNAVVPSQEKACLLVPGGFAARQNEIDHGFDPTGADGPWASVSVDGTSQVVEFSTAVGLTSRVTFSVASGGDKIGVSSQTGSSGKFNITLSGQSAGTAVVEAKLDGNAVIGRLNVMVLPQRAVSVAIYRIEDPSSPNTAIPPGNDNEIDDLIMSTLNEVYKQSAITFTKVISQRVPVNYDADHNGIMNNEMSSLNQGSWGGQIRLFLFKQGPDGVGGGTPDGAVFSPASAVFMVPADRVPIHSAHEFGHVLELPVIQNSPDSEHDKGPWPAGTWGLMGQGRSQAPPGKWLRHEDWLKSNGKAGEL